MKGGKHGGIIKNLIEPSDKNEMEMMKSKVEYDGEDDGATSKAQPKKCENLTSNTDMIIDNMDMKGGKHGGKIKNLTAPNDKNEMEMMKIKVEQKGEDDGATNKEQPKKYENPISHTDMNNDNTDMKGGKHGGKIKNLTEPIDENEKEMTKNK